MPKNPIIADPVIRKVLHDLDARLVQVVDNRPSPYVLIRQLMADDRLSQQVMWKASHGALKMDTAMNNIIGGVLFDSDGRVFVIRRQDG